MKLSIARGQAVLSCAIYLAINLCPSSRVAAQSAARSAPASVAAGSMSAAAALLPLSSPISLMPGPQAPSTSLASTLPTVTQQVGLALAEVGPIASVLPASAGNLGYRLENILSGGDDLHADTGIPAPSAGAFGNFIGPSRLAPPAGGRALASRSSARWDAPTTLKAASPRRSLWSRLWEFGETVACAVGVSLAFVLGALMGLLRALFYSTIALFK